MSRSPIEVRSDIDAPLVTVWAVISDFASYARWNSFVIAMAGPETLRVGSVLTVRSRFRDGRENESEQLVTRHEVSATEARLEYALTGFLARAGLLRAHRVQTLRSTSPETTRYETLESFSGFAAFMLPWGPIERGLADHTLDLKLECEARYAAARNPRYRGV